MEHSLGLGTIAACESCLNHAQYLINLLRICVGNDCGGIWYMIPPFGSVCWHQCLLQSHYLFGTGGLIPKDNEGAIAWEEVCESRS